jgi:ribosome-associated protein
MDIRKLQRLVVDALDDIKGQDIRVFDTTGLSDLFDRVVLATGTSNRHARSLAGNVAEKAKAAGAHVVSVEGEEGGEWVLVDLGDLIVHVMQPAVRSYYALEEIWGAKPVSVSVRRAPAKTAKTARVAKTAKAAKAAKTAKTDAVAKPAKVAKTAKSAKTAKTATSAKAAKSSRTAASAPAAAPSARPRRKPDSKD